jgi:nitrogenase-stabilizing/protective protein
MDTVLERMNHFSAAEEFLDYLGVDYDRAVVNVNRLHILKRFQQYIGPLEPPSGLSEEGLRAYYRDLLGRAYEDFVHSNAAAEKVFKVFQDAAGVQHVSVESLRASLSSGI